jgi:copper chaperone CopZ
MIARVAGKIKGVSEAEVRYTTNKLLVRFDDSLTSWEEIEKAVAKLGYQVVSAKQEEE